MQKTGPFLQVLCLLLLCASSSRAADLLGENAYDEPSTLDRIESHLVEGLEKIDEGVKSTKSVAAIMKEQAEIKTNQRWLLVEREENKAFRKEQNKVNLSVAKLLSFCVTGVKDFRKDKERRDGFWLGVLSTVIGGLIVSAVAVKIKGFFSNNTQQESDE